MCPKGKLQTVLTRVVRFYSVQSIILKKIRTFKLLVCNSFYLFSVCNSFSLKRQMWKFFNVINSCKIDVRAIRIKIRQ